MDEDEGRAIPAPELAGGPLTAPPRLGPTRSAAPAIADLAAQVADRLLVGVSRDGHPEVRFAIERGALQGVEVRLAETPRGVAVTFLTESDSLRHALEAPLVELKQALLDRGLAVEQVEVARRAEVGDRAGGDPRPGEAGDLIEAGISPRTAAASRAAALPPLLADGTATDYIA